MNVDWNEFKKRINSLEKCSTPLERTEDGRVVRSMKPRIRIYFRPMAGYCVYDEFPRYSGFYLSYEHLNSNRFYWVIGVPMPSL